MSGWGGGSERGYLSKLYLSQTFARLDLHLCTFNFICMHGPNGQNDCGICDNQEYIPNVYEFNPENSSYIFYDVKDLQPEVSSHM